MSSSCTHSRARFDAPRSVLGPKTKLFFRLWPMSQRFKCTVKNFFFDQSRERVLLTMALFERRAGVKHQCMNRSTLEQPGLRASRAGAGAELMIPGTEAFES